MNTTNVESGNSNRRIFEWLNPETHWHEWRNDAAILCFTCRECGITWSNGRNPNPDYTRPADCLNLVDAVRAKGYRYSVQDAPGGYGHFAEFWHPDTGTDIGWRSPGDTFCEAVVGAVLKLILESEEKKDDAG